MPKPVRVTVTAEGSRRLYNTRSLKSGDMADLDYASVDPAIILGLVQRPTGWVSRFGLLHRPIVEQETDKAPARPRGRPRKSEPTPTKEPEAKNAEPEKVEPEEPKLEDHTVDELREMAEEKGVVLPSGYVRKDELIELVGQADEDE